MAQNEDELTRGPIPMINWYSNETLGPIALRFCVSLAIGVGLAMWLDASKTVWLVAVGVPMLLGALALRQWRQMQVAKRTTTRQPRPSDA